MPSTITVGNANVTRNEKEVQTRYPVEEGLTAGTNKIKGRIPRLTAVKSFVPERESCGL